MKKWKRDCSDKESVHRESQNLWQKVTSLRQSFRNKSNKVILNKEEKNNRLHRNWSFQRNSTRERQKFCSNPSGSELSSPSTTGRKQAYSYAHGSDISEWEVAKKVLDIEMSVVKRGHHRHQRSARKLTKDSGYETSAQGDQDYGSIEWTSQMASSCENIGHQEGKSHTLEKKHGKNINQREVERRASTESLSISKHISTYLSTESVPGCGNVTYAKSTPILSVLSRESPPPPYTPLAISVSQQQHEMVTRRFRKGSVHGVPSSNSGTDIAPATHTDHCWEKQESALHTQRNKSPEIGPSGSVIPNCNFRNRVREDSALPSVSQAMKHVPYDHSSKNADSLSNLNTCNKAINAQITIKQQSSNHEKYPSWPVTSSGIMSNVVPTTSNQRSHSWTAHTDYRKERTTYSRPQKAFKIATNQLQPVLERPSDINKKKILGVGKSNLTNSCIKKTTAEPVLNRSLHTLPCLEDNECRSNINSSQSLQLGRSKERMELPTTCLNKYDSFLSHYDHHTSPPSTTSGSSGYGGWSKDTCTPFLDRLRLESVAMPCETPSDVGNWTESAKGHLKWHGAGSYSDLSSFSVQMSNRSSLFDSGHSTMPDSGRLSPQSSCSGSILLCGIETGPRRAQVVSRHGCHRESIAHSSKVQPPQRHGSESVVYYGLHQSDSTATKQPPSEQSKLYNKQSKSCSQNAVETCYEQNIQRFKNSEHSEASISKLRQFCSELKVYTCSSEQNDFKSKCIDEKISSKLNSDKQSLSEFELKTIQKQAVLSFFQRQKEKTLESTSSNQSSQWRKSLPPFKCNEISNSKIENPVENPPKTNQYGKLKESQDYKTIGHHSRSVPNLSELRHESMNAVRASASQISKCNLWQNQMNGKVASLATMFGGVNFSTNKIIRNDVKDPSVDGADNISATSYFHSHKTSHKTELKEIHQADEASKIKVFNSDGITLLETTERKKINEENNYSKPPQVPPRRLQKHINPPVRQPPSRPPPPPPQSDVIEERINTETKDIRQNTSLYNHNLHYEKCPSPELPPPPPPPCTDSDICLLDEPLPPPPDPSDIDMSGQSHGQNSLIYPKNSYMCYRSERKLGRHGFDGNYHRVSTAPSICQESCIKISQNDMSSMSPSSWEQLHNIRQHGPTVIFHSDSIHGQLCNNEVKTSNSDFSGICPNNCSSSSNPKDGEHSATILVCANNIERTSSDQPVPTSTLSNVTVHNTSHEKTAEIELHDDTQIALLTKNNQEESMNNSHKLFPTRLREKTSEKHSESSQKILQEHFSDSTKDINRICCSDSCNSNDDTALCHGKNVHPDNQIKNSEMEQLQPTSASIDTVPRISCATQTTDTPSLRRKVKTKEELECEQLSLDFIDHCHDRTLKNLLVPLPDQKTMSDYMEGLLDIELETAGHTAVQRLHVENTTTIEPSRSENSKEEKSGFLLASPYCLTSESDAKLLTRYSKNTALPEKIKDTALMNKRENLMASIGRKLNKLRLEQVSIREEIAQNDILGQHVTACVEAVAKPNELEKYMLHVEELDKIINLLLSLSGRLARAQNALINLSEEASEDDKKILEAKRDKLSEQHEDARRLKESIDRRSQQVSTFLHQYLSKEEYADYDHFIKMKSKFLLESREIEEKIKLGEEQLTTLCNGMNWQRWKH